METEEKDELPTEALDLARAFQHWIRNIGVRKQEGEDDARYLEQFTLVRQTKAALFVLSKPDVQRIGIGTMSAMLGYHAGALEMEWDDYDRSRVARMLVTALLCGCVPLPRTKPVPIDELPDLLSLPGVFLPPCTNDDPKGG